MSLPPKPVAPVVEVTKEQSTNSNASPVVYKDFLAKDATSAGVSTPSYDEISRKLVVRSDAKRHVLEVGERAITVAGLKLTAVQESDALVLEIQNTTKADLAYLVVTTPTPNVTGCSAAVAFPFNAMVVARGQSLRRVECVFRPGMAIAITRVETVELSPLSAFYFSQVSPNQVGIEDRIARGHQRVKSEKCISLDSQVLRTGIENGEIGWRDLVDFYARHRCQTYVFPAEYRAFATDAEQQLPVMPRGM